MKTAPTSVVFLGPSLDVNEAAMHLSARFLPPIRRGDLPRTISEGAQAVGIIDGEFGQSLAVSVMEICAGLRRGIRIWGAASMGALRAVECQSEGMSGVGWIYQRYAEGDLKADDEVALLFEPRSYRAATIPLVNVRWSLQQAIEERLVLRSSESDLLRLARTMHYTVRTCEALVEAACGTPLAGPMGNLVEFIKQDPQRCDRKRLDALLLLDAMRKAETESVHA